MSGIQHVPFGAAQVGAADGRRLPVRNLGSSGEDGVEVRARSAAGAAVGVDLTGFGDPSATNREIRIRPKGWDGTIKGNMRAYVSSTTGQTVLAADFADWGAPESSYVEYDEAGNIVASGFLPHEGLAAGPCPNQYQIWYVVLHLTSLGPPRQYTVTWHYFCSDCPDPWGWWLPGGCGGVSTQRTIVITPHVQPGTLGLDNLDALVVTGRDLPDVDGDGAPELVVGNAALGSFPVPCPPWDCFGPEAASSNLRWGLGQAHVDETCTPDSMGGCDESVRRLAVGNLGSSGQDGVAIALPGDNGGVAVSLAKGNCCRGHVIIMKLYDDEGQQQRIIRTQSSDPNDPFDTLDADFSAIGATGFRLTLFGPGGGVVGPPSGTEILSGGPKPTLTGKCPFGSNEIWENIGTTSNPVWHFVGCTPNFPSFDFVLPGVGLVPDVASFRIEPVGATSAYGRAARCEIVSDDPEGIAITNIAVTPAGCTGDANCDAVVSWRDIDYFIAGLNDNVAAWTALFQAAGPSCPFSNLDANGDTHVTWRDIDPFIARLNTVCP